MPYSQRSPGSASSGVVSAAFWHEPTRALYTGDLVIGDSSVMIDTSHGGNLMQYLASLERALELEPRQLFPAHGPRVNDPAALLRSAIEHRRDRERQVIAAIAAGHRTGGGPCRTSSG